MSQLTRVLHEVRERRQRAIDAAKNEPEREIVWVDVELKDVRPGDWATRIDQDLDPRPVAEVDHDRDMVQLDVLGRITPPIPIEFYRYHRMTTPIKEHSA